MLTQVGWSALVRVGPRVEPRHVAADLHETLSMRHPRACWIHAQDDLSAAVRFALDQPDHPLVVTTNARDWSPFDNDRAWTNRGAALVCVLTTAALANVSAQVETMFLESFAVRRAPVLDEDEDLLPLFNNAHRLVSILLDVSAQEVVARQVGLDWNRIIERGTAELKALHLVWEACRCSRRVVHLCSPGVGPIADVITHTIASTIADTISGTMSRRPRCASAR